MKFIFPKVGHLLKFKSELKKITVETIGGIKDKTKLAIERIQAADTAEREEFAARQAEQEQREIELAAVRARNDPRRLQIVRDIEFYKFTFLQLLEKGYHLNEIEAAGFDPRQLNNPPIDGRILINTRKFSVDQLRAWNYPDAQIFTVSEMKSQGLTLRQLKEIAGYSTKELREAGFESVSDLKNAGCTVAELIEAGFTASDIKKAGCDRTAGFQISDIIKEGFTVSELKEAGCTAAELKDAGFTISDLKGISFTVTELKDAGFSVPELVEAGFTVSDLLRAGIDLSDEVLPVRISSSSRESSVADVMGVYLPTEERRNGLPVYRLEGIDDDDVPFLCKHDDGDWTIGTSSDLIMYVDSLNSLLPQALYKRKWDINQKKVVVSVMVCSGLSVSELKDAGFQISDIVKEGFTAAELKDAGFQISELKEEGFTVSDLLRAGIDLSDEVLPVRISSSSREQQSVADVTGVYLPTEERHNGLPVYRLEGSNDDVGLFKHDDGDWTIGTSSCFIFYVNGSVISSLLPQAFHNKEWTIDGTGGNKVVISVKVCSGLSVSQLKEAGFQTWEIVNEGFSYSDVRI